jgi:sulfite reductase alpha subunit-like flavoprotein
LFCTSYDYLLKITALILTLTSFFHDGCRLKKSLPSDLLKGVTFAIFNLGDRAYGPQFCAAGRKLAVRLLQLGATLLIEPGYGDDATSNGGVFADLDFWLEENLLVAFQKHGKMRSGGPVSFTPSPAYHVLVSASQSSSENEEEEWEQEDFLESYRSFFQHLCPATAYCYDTEIPRRRITSGKKTEKPPLVGRVLVNERITATDWEQDTRHIRVYMESKVESEPTTTAAWDLASLPYQAGDVASILPSNPDDEVERFLQVLPLDIRNLADCELHIENDDTVVDLFGVGCSFWPRRCTLRGWLTHCADIHALPEREDLRALSFYCSQEHPHGKSQLDKLVSLSETTDAALYADYILREKRGWVDVLYDFDSLQAPGSLLTMKALLSLLAPLRPRDFSIASSPSHDYLSETSGSTATCGGFGIEICAAVVQGVSPLGRSNHGLCSYYLSQRTAVDSTRSRQSSIRLWIRPGSFSGLPLEVEGSGETGNPKLQTPVLFVAAGTGIAPIRGLILEREAVRILKSSVGGLDDLRSPANDNVGELDHDNVLLFGCRKEEADFYYEKEWKDMEQSGRLGLLTAFSRDQWHKIYVQQKLRKADEDHAFLARHVIEKNGAIYIAGGPKMARAVKEEIIESLGRTLDGGENQAVKLLGKLQRLGRYSVEAWG